MTATQLDRLVRQAGARRVRPQRRKGRQAAAYGAALAVLRERHRAEFDELYDAELRRSGLR